MANIIPVKIEISARHIHLAPKHLDILFGKGFQLEKESPLSQTEEFAAKQTVIIKTDKAEFQKVRIVGPLREQTQVEISKTDARILGINPPIRKSEEIEGSAKATLIGPAGQVDLHQGVIIAKRHLHCSIKEAKENNLKANQIIAVKIEGERSLTFQQVVVRVADDFTLAVHLDTDEANAAGLNASGQGVLIVD